METVNKTHFAKMCGVSKAAIGKACDTGSIKTVGTGRKQSINLKHKLTQEYLRSKTVVKPPPVQKGDKTEITAPPVGDDAPPDLMITSIDDVNGRNIDTVDKILLQKFKLQEEILNKRQEREVKRGELIARTMVRLVFSKLYSIYVNQFKTMEDRLTPEICGIFKFADGSPEAVKLREILSGDNAKTLNSVHRLFNDFLRGIKADKI